jgi:hypothetical protein
LFSTTNSLTAYVYNFGDWWEHTVAFEKAFSIQADVIIRYALEESAQVPLRIVVVP